MDVFTKHFMQMQIVEVVEVVQPPEIELRIVLLRPGPDKAGHVVLDNHGTCGF